MPDIRTLVEEILPVRTLFEGDTFIIEGREGQALCRTEDRDWAMVLHAILNRYFLAEVSEEEARCPRCGGVTPLRFIEDQQGNLTLETLCITGAKSNNPCPEMFQIPIMRNGEPRLPTTSA